MTQNISQWEIPSAADTSGNHLALLHWKFKYHTFKNNLQFKRSAYIHQRWAQNNQNHRENFMWKTFIFPQHLTIVAFCRSLHFHVIVQSLSCVRFCDPLDCRTPGFPVFHHFLEFAQTHVHWIRDAIQPSHPLSSPSPHAINLSQQKGLF